MINNRPLTCTVVCIQQCKQVKGYVSKQFRQRYTLAYIMHVSKQSIIVKHKTCIGVTNTQYKNSSVYILEDGMEQRIR